MPTSAAQLYKELKLLSTKMPTLQAKFAAFRKCADFLLDSNSGFVGLTVHDKGPTEFDVAYCGEIVRFSLLARISSEGSSVGVVNCQRLPLAPEAKPIFSFSFKPNGETNAAKPQDFSDDLYLDDNHSAVFLIASGIGAALKQ